MTPERRYVLIVAGIILAASILVGVGIAIETGDIWHGLRSTGFGIVGAFVAMSLLRLVGRASGNH